MNALRLAVRSGFDPRRQSPRQMPQIGALFGLCLLSLVLALPALAARHAKSAEPPVPPLHGSLVLLAPSVHLEEARVGHLEQRSEWNDAARPLLLDAMHQQLTAVGIQPQPDYTPPVDLPSDSPMAQSLQLGALIADSMAWQPPPKRHVFRHPPPEPAVTENIGVEGANALLEATKADYALLTQVHAQYNSGGRKAARAGAIAGGVAMNVLSVLAALLGNGSPDFVSVDWMSGPSMNAACALVDLHTGDIIWSRTTHQVRDLRQAAGIKGTALTLLEGLPKLDSVTQADAMRADATMQPEVPVQSDVAAAPITPTEPAVAPTESAAPTTPIAPEAPIATAVLEPEPTATPAPDPTPTP
ncbi:hypothetical protein [Lysobacter fragariae]